MVDTEALAARSLEILATLVGFDTTSRGSNLALIEYVEGELLKLGVTGRRVPNADGTKSNLFASIGPAVEENTDLVSAGRSRVWARSGNQHWNDDGDGREFDLAADGPEAAPAAPVATSKITAVQLALGALVIGAAVWLLCRRKA